MADDFQLIIKQMEKERKDKIAADKKAEARQLINNEKSLKAFQDQSNKDADKLQELLTSFATEVNASNRESIQAQIDNLKEDRRIKEEIEKGRLEDIEDRRKEKAESKDIRRKKRKESE